MKFLLWLAIGFAVIWLLRSKKQQIHTETSQHRRAAPSDRREIGTERMVRCVHCDLYLPASEAISNSSGQVFCCQEHRSKHSPAST
jgi:uncharacterized protein